jgi:hypothetical protein
MSMYMRVFGDELAYFGYNDAQIMDSVRAKVDPVYVALNLSRISGQLQLDHSIPGHAT